MAEHPAPEIKLQHPPQQVSINQHAVPLQYLLSGSLHSSKKSRTGSKKKGKTDQGTHFTNCVLNFLAKHHLRFMFGFFP